MAGLSVSCSCSNFALMIHIRTSPDAVSDNEQRNSGDVRTRQELGLIECRWLAG